MMLGNEGLEASAGTRCGNCGGWWIEDSENTGWNMGDGNGEIKNGDGAL